MCCTVFFCEIDGDVRALHELTHAFPTRRSSDLEIFGPVLSVVLVTDLGAAIALGNAHEYGNGVASFTRDGAAARGFAQRLEVGMVGVNVPIPEIGRAHV